MKLHQLVENKNMTPKQAWVNLMAAIDELGEDEDKTLSKTKTDETGGLGFIKTLQDQGVVFDADTAMHWAMDSVGSFEVTHKSYKSPKESDSKAGKQLQNFILKTIGEDDPEYMHKIDEAEQKEASLTDILAAVNAIAGGNGRQVIDIHDVSIDTVAFSVLFDFPEGFVKGSEAKAAGKGSVKSVSAQKGERWREGEFGADYEITLKTPMAPSDASKVQAALKKLQ